MHRTRCFGFCFGLCLVLALTGAVSAQTAPVALTGTLVMPDVVIEHGTVLIQGGRILASGEHVDVPRGTKTISVDGVIAPGFIDLHNHMIYNVFPRWKPIEEFGSRYDWQQKPVYNTLITVPEREMHEANLGCTMERYAEIKALAQGETSVVGTEPGCSPALARELDQDPKVPGSGKVVYNVFPFQMSEAALASARAALDATPRGSLLIHVSEGGPHDASATREFQMLAARGLLRTGVSVIHGVAIPAAGFAKMAAAGVGLVWSPRSNVELYGDTANVAAAKAAGVTIALAPDWSPTGSTGLLGELMYASLWNGTQAPSPFTDRDLVMMATSNPAHLVGLEGQLGSLAAGHAADLLIVRRTQKDAYASLTHTAPADVELVVEAGAPLYGDPLLLREFGVAAQPVTVCGAEKALAASAGYPAAVAELAPAMARTNRALAPLAECGD